MNKNKNIIIKALAISEMEYGELVFNSAHLWMRCFYSEDALIIIDGLERSKLFWSWWSNQWENRDCEFISLTGFDENTIIIDEDTLKITRSLYKSLHNVYNLRIKPNRFAVNEAYKIIRGLKIGNGDSISNTIKNKKQNDKSKCKQ